MKRLVLILAVAVATLTGCKKGNEPEPQQTQTPAAATHYLTVQWSNVDVTTKKTYINGVLTAGEVNNVTVHTGDVIQCTGTNSSGYSFGSSTHTSMIVVKMYIDGVMKVEDGSYGDTVDRTYTVE
jgi:PBP1b-binding outer membrane lipoprotein LpoB